MLAAEFILSSPLISYAYFILSYALLGAMLKLIDAAFDERAFSRRIAVVIAPLAGILWAFNMSLSPGSATLLAAIFLSALLARKINNAAFLLGAAAIFLAAVAFGLFQPLLLPLAALAVAGIIDEKGNDYADAGKIKSSVLHFFFAHRSAMKLAALALALLLYLAWVYLIALLAFDLAYEWVSRRAASRKCLPPPAA